MQKHDVGNLIVQTYNFIQMIDRKTKVPNDAKPVINDGFFIYILNL